jgi:sodium-dependent dicarboxylate transporter 2/3/5
MAVSAVLAFAPEYDGLSEAGRRGLFILLSSAGLWITEAIPPFAVGLQLIGLAIALLGRPGGVFASGPDDWEIFIQPWSSPLLWLFFGGFVLAEGARKTGLDRTLAAYMLGITGHGRRGAILGIMAATFTFSMFMSNTATTAMMLAVIAPTVTSLDAADPFRRALVLSVPVAANVGGMGTLIGSPPNAIAAGAIRDITAVNFADWLVIGIPPATLSLAVAWLYLVRGFPADGDAGSMRPGWAHADGPGSPPWQQILVSAVFVATVLLWMTTSLHGIPATVISFLPVVALTVVGVLDAADIRRLPWDVLLLISGGLSLGVVVTETGLAGWLVARIPTGSLPVLAVVMIMAYSTAVLSNFISNTAAANILIPIGVALTVTAGPQTAVSIALSASAAMCLPVSTPPNALAFGSGLLDSRDFLPIGLIFGAVAPAASVLWSGFVLG